MVVAFDSSVLLLYLDPECRAPSVLDDEGNFQPVPDAHERVAYLVEQLEKAKASIIVPTPVLSEILTGAGAARDQWIEQLQRSARFRIAPFCSLSAIELAEIERQTRASGSKRGPTPDSAYQKVKFDRQIVTIVRTNGAETIYGNDGDIRAHAELAGVAYYNCAELTKRPQDNQQQLPLEDQNTEEKAAQEDEAETVDPESASSTGEQGSDPSEGLALDSAEPSGDRSSQARTQPPPTDA